MPIDILKKYVIIVEYQISKMMYNKNIILEPNLRFTQNEVLPTFDNI